VDGGGPNEDLPAGAGGSARTALDAASTTLHKTSLKGFVNANS
jgi:hypothetical protein